ncbi:hypothetical protein E1B28_003280 [Marasmius oreades]|uniref:Uncharacterized protein n=1 Tax=Marasmius oreades TaxID=181124 RepID=A0A9P7RLL1_9AGAR|nr:uncharacterized protein E1B28_003280 [Marasmius oreades]KAG7085737.1 hypothetical protein E1B28_003280 [Marasmius oreades]
MSRRTLEPALRNSNSVTVLPLQDITETIHADTIPNNRPKRRTKVPKGALGRKLKRTAQPAAQTSSLPPSSPIGPSSADFLPIASSDDGIKRLQEVEGQGHGFWMDEDREEDWKGNIDFSSQCYDGDGNYIALRFQDAAEEEVPIANDPDPFGFFAVEEKLKAERSRQPLKPSKPLLPPSKPTTLPLNPPCTPHKRRIGRHAVTASSRSSSPGRSNRLPSSPSPAKRPSERFVTRETNLDNDEEIAPLIVDHDDTPPKADGRRKKPRRDDSPVSPERLAKSLTCLLPRRRRRGKNPRTYKDEDDSEDEQPTAKRQTRRRQKPREAVRQDEDGEIDVDVERMAQERQARLEYFKKLQNYEIAKENVYVI